ncbi:MAG: multidrug efflux SMR transporter [Salinivirgaceae bacterium]|jgi:quaternary ammonium compound-resistance protein SugE|nr:multidrug efflux SMR transporter [Salinivirgaceae bacterium]
MGWLYLLLAAILEIGWPFGLKMSQTVSNQKLLWILFAVLSMAGSGFLLWVAQKTIPMGTAYAVWTGLGAVGAFVLGILYFNDSASMFRIASVTLLILGIIGLKLSS